MRNSNYINYTDTVGVTLNSVKLGMAMTGIVVIGLWLLKNVNL